MEALTQNAGYKDFLTILRLSRELLNEAHIREEIYSTEKLEQYAIELAQAFKVDPKLNKGRSLKKSLKESSKELLKTYKILSDAIGKKQVVSPAAEWFVDNFHIVEDQIRGIKLDLPQNYYYELPKLSTGALAGFPRVYALALALISPTDSRLEYESLQRFLKSFQSVSPLKIGEIWAVPITLRLALVEQLKALSIRIVNARKKRQEADVLADKILTLAAQNQTQPDELIRVLSAEMGDPDNFDRAFVVQLASRLRDQDPDVWATLDWLEVQLSSVHNTSIEKVIQLEHNVQAVSQVTVGNIISSMRLISSMDWRDFFESVSLVDPILASDPSGTYPKMDFATRDMYRHAIERISKQSKVNELDVAKKAIEVAARAKVLNAKDKKKTHVGYYLVDEGKLGLEKIFSYKPKLLERFSRWIVRNPTFTYLTLLGILTTLILLPPVKYLMSLGVSLPWTIAFALVALLTSSEFAVSILNHYVNFFVKPRALPKMDTVAGIPDTAKTFVVVPTMFAHSQDVVELIESLEVRSLANQEKNIYFALLVDFPDADVEKLDSDQELFEQAKARIQELNQKYSQTNSGTENVVQNAENRFYLFQRKRKWNEQEQKWIAWERKRGKLHEFNRLLRGDTETTFIGEIPSSDFLNQIQYVITLDSDTQLPRDAARTLVGTITHPLNMPVFDPAKGRVVSGYGILQPRVSVSYSSSTSSRFAHVFSGHIGLDPYTTAVSDVYQDLFSEGSFVGKGLYVVDAFEAALKDRVPENHLLSHDLFEGSYARCALVTDVEFIDDYPSDFDTYAKRQHRWTRGDWQIAQWLFPRVPSASRDFKGRTKVVKNQLSLISKWKIFDNLRRSLSIPSMLLWLSLAWTILPGNPFLWTVIVLLVLAFPIYAPITNNVFAHKQGMPWRGRLKNILSDIYMQLGPIFLTLVFLVELSLVQLDAIVRTLYRKIVSKRKLLEWTTFAQTQKKTESQSIFEKIGPSPVFSTILLFLVIQFKPTALYLASPILLAWIFTPLFKAWIGVKAPVDEKLAKVQGEQFKTFRHYSRRTWHYFETFLRAEDHYLAPDNFQEDPAPVVDEKQKGTMSKER